MDFETFLNDTAEEIKRRLGSCYQVCSRTIRKNNGVMRRAVVISDDEHKTAPCYYMENYYELYQKQEDIGIIAEDIVNTYRKEEKPDFSFEWLYDRKQVLERVLFRIIGTDRNTGLLENAPHHDMPGLGLSAVFYIMAGADCRGAASVMIRNRHMEMLGVSEEELWEYAWRNTPEAMGCSISSIAEILGKLLCGTASGAGYPAEAGSMYVVTNRKKLYGAGCILYPGVLEKLAQESGCDLYIFPSSIHEMIAVPSEKFDRCRAEELKQMVTEINQKELACEEVLADSVYYYSRKEQKLFLAA